MQFHYKVIDFQSGEGKGCGFMGNDTVYFGKWVPAFRRNILSAFSG
jgi:hypothetical protein